MLLSEAIKLLLIATRADGRTRRTVYSYREKLSHVVTFLGDVPVESITVDDLRRYVADQMDRLSPFTVQTRTLALKRLFNWLVEEGRLDSSPARRIKTPRPKRTEPKGVSQDDVLRLLASMVSDSAADLRDRAIVMFLYDTGCRVGGLCGLRLDDLDLDGGLALVTEKGGKTRYVIFSPATARALRRWLEVRPKDRGLLVFVSLKSKGALKTGGVAQMLARRARQAGCTGPTNAHAFRHGFARHFLMSGGDLATLADILGHSDVGVTKAYYGIFTVQELKAKHQKHSPITGLFGGNENGN